MSIDSLNKRLEALKTIENDLQEIKDSYSERQKLKNLSKQLFNEVWCVAYDKCQEQLQKVYDRLFGNGLSNFGKVLLQFLGQDMNWLYSRRFKNE